MLVEFFTSMVQPVLMSQTTNTSLDCWPVQNISKMLDSDIWTHTYESCWTLIAKTEQHKPQICPAIG